MDLLDDAVARVRTVVAEKNPDLTSAELDTIAEQAGIGAVKYADLSTSRVKDYTFDPFECHRSTAIPASTCSMPMLGFARFSARLALRRQ
ncbi:arginine--tRNA ligase [Nocardia asteroides]|uniref:arginine--tRNA ligase domain-containing protein n=1 Tax=Nocardia asteroides TaxID=1824 RepID=UPI0037C743C0